MSCLGCFLPLRLEPRVDGSGVLSAPCQNLDCPYFVRLRQWDEFPLPFGDKAQQVPDLDVDFSAFLSDELQSETAGPSTAAPNSRNAINPDQLSLATPSTANSDLSVLTGHIRDGNTLPSGKLSEMDVDDTDSDSELSEMDWISDLDEPQLSSRSLPLLGAHTSAKPKGTNKTKDDEGKGKARAHSPASPALAAALPEIPRDADASSHHDAHIKRPPNMWVLYRADAVKKLPKMNISQASKAIGDMWKHEPQSVKDRYAQRAAELKEQHKIAFPDYKYHGRRKILVKRPSTSRNPGPRREGQELVQDEHLAGVQGDDE